jgi:hypothetical protein
MCDIRTWEKRLFFDISSTNTDTVMCISDLRRGFELANRFIAYSQVVTTVNYNTFKITVIITHK